MNPSRLRIQFQSDDHFTKSIVHFITMNNRIGFRTRLNRRNWVDLNFTQFRLSAITMNPMTLTDSRAKSNRINNKPEHWLASKTLWIRVLPGTLAELTSHSLMPSMLCKEWMKDFSVIGLTAETFTDTVNINVYSGGKEINDCQWVAVCNISKT